MMTLYDYFRSSASYRVRIALNLKEIDHVIKEVHLVNNGGEQHSAAYQSLNAQERVPTLEDGAIVLTQSMAILEYLEEQHPTPSLLGTDPLNRAQIRSFANVIACDVHPLDNLSVLRYLKGTLGVSDEQKTTWYHHWIHQGFKALEKQLEQHRGAGPYCFGEQVSLADVCLIPQVYNAHRFECDMTKYPLIEAVNAACLALPAFASAAP